MKRTKILRRSPWKPRPAKPSKRSSIAPRNPIKRGGRIKPKKRSAAEFARIYHSRERMLFVKALPCVVPFCGPPCENHHIENGGTGRKSDYTKIAPLCLLHHEQCHHIGRQSFESVYGINLEAAAAETERLWLQRQEDDAA